MSIYFSSQFEKDRARIPPAVQKQLTDRLRIFAQNSADPLLRNHKLHGKYAGYRSINISGDIRAIFIVQEEVCVFLRIGTHSELFE